MRKVGRKTLRYEFDGVVVRCVDEVSRSTAQAWAASFESWFGADRRTVPGAESKGHIALLESASGTAVVKRERMRGLKRRLIGAGLRRFQSEIAFERALAFEAAGLPTGAPLACVLARERVEACTLSRWIDGRDPWHHISAARNPERARAQVVDALATLVASMHAAGFRHRDLKAPNLIATARAAEFTLSVVDVDGLATVRSIGFATRARDLGRLCVSFHSQAASAAGVAGADWQRCIELYVASVGSLEQRALDGELLLRRTRAWADAHRRGLLARGRDVA